MWLMDWHFIGSTVVISNQESAIICTYRQTSGESGTVILSERNKPSCDENPTLRLTVNTK